MGVVASDNVWILISTALVLLMSLPALAIFYGGLTRTKNILNTIMMVGIAFSIGSILWLFFGYSLVFGPDVGGIIGSYKYFFLNSIASSDTAPIAKNLYHYLFIFFQMTFAAITVALMAGAFTERMKFCAWIAIVILWSIIIYAPVAHWIWGGGFLSSLGAVDFAGGIVVHESSGISALVGTMLLGRRKDASMLPANLPLVGVGTGLLWFGWFGFNGGSAMGINPQAISAAFATTIAALSAGIVWVLLEWKKFGKPTSLGLFTGYIAGLATITPASGFVDVLGAFFIGIVGAILCFWAVVYLKNRFKYDDSLDVFGVHGIGGIAGSILLAFFAKSSIGNINGIFYGAKFSVLIPQIIAVIVVGIYSIIGTFAIFKIVEKFIGLRVSIEDEIAGLDENIHGESAYAKEY